VWRKLLRFLFWTAVVLGIVVGLARLVAIRWWRVPENDPFLEASIAPTLRGGDLVLLWRLTKPTFGDLVVCPEPEATDRLVIGRVLAEEGDTLTFREGTLALNGRYAETERGCGEFEVFDPNSGSAETQLCQVETLGGTSHTRGSTSGHKLPPITTEKEVPPGQIFLVSDNRLFPYDSRDFGEVDRTTCTETIVFRIVSARGYFDQESRFSFIH
jgi:signal peptidase I